MEKLCVFCESHEWERPYDASSCPTCGPCIEGGFSCSRGYYKDVIPYCREEYRQLLLTAVLCDDYTPPTGGQP